MAIDISRVRTNKDGAPVRRLTQTVPNGTIFGQRKLGDTWIEEHWASNGQSPNSSTWDTGCDLIESADDNGKSAEPPAADVREAAALALFRYKWPDCSQWPGAKPGPDEYTAVDIVLAAYEKARPRLSSGAKQTIENALGWFNTTAPGDVEAIAGHVAAARAELERLG